MALRNLRSDLAVGDLATPAAADLTFGKGTAYDRPNQEFSREPFITKGLNFDLSSSTINSITDGFIRGGIVYSTERRAEDANRIGRFLLTNKGITFLAKQVGLQKSNPKISEPVRSRSDANQRTYTALGINTITQIGLQGTGTHLKREGFVPFNNTGYIDDERLFVDYKENDNTNKLLYLYDNHISFGSSNTENEPKTVFGKITQGIVKFFKGPGEELYSYNGGPGSTYGIGRTKIQKYSPTKGFQLLTGVIGGPKPLTSEESVSDENAANAILNITNYGSGPDYPRSFSPNNIVFGRPPAKDLEDLNAQDKNFDDNGGNYEYNTDFNEHNDTTGKDGRVSLNIKNYLKTLKRSNAVDYSEVNREKKFGLGHPGQKPSSGQTRDTINQLDIFTNKTDIVDPRTKDFIRFRIEAVNSNNPLESNVMIFRAFLDSLDDNYSANYNEFNYNGRGESFYTYNSFNRDISFSFKIAAQAESEMKYLYRKLNYILSNTAPEYDTKSGRIKTPFMRVTIGDYLNRLPGVITNITTAWNTNYPFEINIEDDPTVLVLPHVLDVSVSYKPIHDFLPQKGVRSPFIIPNKEEFTYNIANGLKELPELVTADDINNQGSNEPVVPTVEEDMNLGPALNIPAEGGVSVFNF